MSLASARAEGDYCPLLGNRVIRGHRESRLAAQSGLWRRCSCHQHSLLLLSSSTPQHPALPLLKDGNPTCTLKTAPVHTGAQCSTSDFPLEESMQGLLRPLARSQLTRSLENGTFENQPFVTQNRGERITKPLRTQGLGPAPQAAAALAKTCRNVLH